MNNVYHVKPHKNGWQVIRSGNQRATRVFQMKEEAIDYANELTEQKDLDVVQHNQKDAIIKEQSSNKPTEQKPSDFIVDPQINEHNLNEPIVEQSTIRERMTESTPKKKKQGFWLRLLRFFSIDVKR